MQTRASSFTRTQCVGLATYIHIWYARKGNVTWDGRLYSTLAGGQLEAVADEVPREQDHGRSVGSRACQMTWRAAMSSADARSGLRAIDGGLLNDSVKRLHRFQGEHTEVRFTAPHMGGHGRYIAVIPVGTIPDESREITVTSLDLTGLMDQLDDLLPSGHGAPGQQPS